MTENDNIRKTIVTRTISRKINTAPYETLDVGGTWQQEIEWKDKDELWNKTRKFDEYTKLDFLQTFETVVTGLGLNSSQSDLGFDMNKNSSSNIDKESVNNPKNKDDFDGLN